MPLPNATILSQLSSIAQSLAISERLILFFLQHMEAFNKCPNPDHLERAIDILARLTAIRKTLIHIQIFIDTPLPLPGTISFGTPISASANTQTPNTNPPGTPISRLANPHTTVAPSSTPDVETSPSPSTPIAPVAPSTPSTPATPISPNLPIPPMTPTPLRPISPSRLMRLFTPNPNPSHAPEPREPLLPTPDRERSTREPAQVREIAMLPIDRLLPTLDKIVANLHALDPNNPDPPMPRIPRKPRPTNPLLPKAEREKRIAECRRIRDQVWRDPRNFPFTPRKPDPPTRSP